MPLKQSSFAFAVLLCASSAAAQDLWTGLRTPGAPTTFSLQAAPDPVGRIDPPPAATLAPPRSVRTSTATGRTQAPAPADESALRYYASQNDTARVASEIRRIRTLHPDWNPPEDLFEEAPDNAEGQRLWDLYGEGKLDEIRTAVEEIRERVPNWRPSTEFVAKFEQAQARQDLIEASTSGDPSQVIILAEARPTLLSCTEMDVMWRVAEALVKTGTPDKAFELYRFVLTRCTDPQERLATVQKASLLLAPTVTEKLLSLGPRASERSGFEAARMDLFRRRLGEAINGGPEVNPSELKSFEALVEQRHAADDAMLLGWLRYSKKDWPAAARWFKLAIAWGSSPKAIEGYALSLREQGVLTEAETVAYDNRKADPLVAKLYVEILATELTKTQAQTMDATRLARVEEVVQDLKSVTGSQALGWYYFNRGATQKANEWFRQSVAWEPIEANVLGLALSSHRLKNMAAFKTLVGEYGGRFPAVAALKRFDTATAPRHVARRSGGGGAGGNAGSKLADEAVALYKSGKYREALDTLNRRAATTPEDQGLSLLRGWSLYHTGEFKQARAHFEALDAKQSTKETQYGKFHANERLMPAQFRAD
jgi:tetratricopeptide (TPR) repeat protein